MNNYMRTAINEARRGMKAEDGGPFGAVVVHKGKVIARSHNEVLKQNDPTKHAEMIAIQRASKKLGRWNLSDCILYTTSEPCPMCIGAVRWAKISKVFFGTSPKNLAEIGFNEESGNMEEEIKIQQIDWQECKKLLEEYDGEIY
jgi:guanine deaminase